MSDDQFTKLFKYMRAELGAVRQEISEVKQAVDEYAGAVDAFAKQSKTYMQLMPMLGTRLTVLGNRSSKQLHLTTLH